MTTSDETPMAALLRSHAEQVRQLHGMRVEERRKQNRPWTEDEMANPCRVSGGKHAMCNDWDLSCQGHCKWHPSFQI